MKLKALKGIVYNACDRIRGVPFQIGHLQKTELPESGEWIIDLKNNSAKDQKGNKIELSFTKMYHEWFTEEIKKADIKLQDIEKAELEIKFNFKNNKPIICSCNIKAAGKTYSYEIVFNLFN